MKKNPGRAMRRRVSAALRSEDSAKKQAVNEQKLLHWSHGNGKFKGLPRFLSNLKGEIV